jgi:hypothetical protein
VSAPADEVLRAALLAAAERRGPAASFCPSEVARTLSADWRPLMPRVRAAAVALQRQGLLRATQRGRTVDGATARGPIRLSKPPG